MGNDRAIAFIGGGNMATSLVGGLLDAGWDPGAITVSDPGEDKRGALADRFGVRVTADNGEAAGGADTVVLAVKPQVLQMVAGEVGRAVKDEPPLVISVAAGVRVESLRQWLGVAAPLVRVMPNTPALVGAGVSALYAGDDVGGPARAEAERIMRAAGDAVWVAREEQMDAVTAVSGSGPAYFFLILEALEEAGVAEGLDRETARTLAVQTAAGSAALARESGDPPAVLRARVTSPGGTTGQGLAALERGGLRAAFLDAVGAAARRSRELGG